MTEEKELRIPARELVKVSVECNCGAELTIDIGRKNHRDADWEHKILKCPMCNGDFKLELRLALMGLSQWYEQMSNCGHRVTLRIRKTSDSEGRES